MKQGNLLNLITIDPKIMGGKPVIHGTRLTVQYILKLLADGWSFGNIKAEYDGISDQDISACILYATEVLDNVEKKYNILHTQHLFGSGDKLPDSLRRPGG